MLVVLACCKTLALTARLLQTLLRAWNGLQDGLQGSGTAFWRRRQHDISWHNFDDSLKLYARCVQKETERCLQGRNALQLAAF